MNDAVGIASDTAIAARSVIMRQIIRADTSLRLDVQRPADSLTGLKGHIRAKLATFITSHLSTAFTVSRPHLCRTPILSNLSPPLQNSDLIQPGPTFVEQRSCPTCPHLCRTVILFNLAPPLQNSDLVQPGPTFAEQRPCPTWPHLCRTAILSNLSPPLQNSDLINPTCPHLCRTATLSNLSPPLQNSDLVQLGPTFAEQRSCPTWPRSAGGPAGDAVPCLPAVDCRRCHGNQSDHSA